jgi:hypothetical protein
MPSAPYSIGSTANRPHGSNPLTETPGGKEISRQKKIEIEREALHLQHQWAQGKHPSPQEVKALVTNGIIYLGAWSATNASNASIKAVSDVSDSESAALAMSVLSTLIGLLDGYTPRQNWERLGYAKAQLKTVLDALAHVLTNKTLSPYELADFKARYGSQLRSALALPCVKEVITQISTDTVPAISSLIKTVADAVLLKDTHNFASDLANSVNDPTLKLALEDLRKAPSKELKDALLHCLGESPTKEEANENLGNLLKNLATQKAWDAGSACFGLVTGLLSFARGCLETMRHRTTKEVLEKKRAALARGIEALQKKPGMKLLTHLFHAASHRITSTNWALVGSSTRALNAVAGLIIKALSIGSVSTGPAGSVIAAAALLIYAVKNYFQKRYDRFANRNENEVNNAFQVAANASPDELEVAIAQLLVKDVQALTVDMNHIKDFLNAMERPDLFESFKAQFQKASDKKQRLALLKSLMESCMPAEDGSIREQMLKSKDGRLQLVGHTMDPPAAPRKDKKPSFPKALNTKTGDATWAEKLYRNKPNKAIASLSGHYPGLHRKTGFFKDLITKAETHLCNLYGRTPETLHTINIAHALDKNKSLVKNHSALLFLIKNPTWELSPEGGNIQQALEAGDVKALNAQTLAAALRKNASGESNASDIASCRFDKVSQAKDHAHLKNMLNTVLQSQGSEHLKTIAEALETGNGHSLVQLAEKLKTSRSDRNRFKQLFETARLMCKHTAQNAGLYDALFRATDLAPDDVRNALLVATGKQLHARIKNPVLLADVLKMLKSQNHDVASHGGVIFVKAGLDERWNRFADDVIAGKCRMEDAPDWLVHRDIKKLFKGRKLGQSSLAGLRDQLQIQLRYNPQKSPLLSLVWPSTVLAEDTRMLEELWRHSFKPLTGIDAKNRSWSELKDAAKLYAACDKCEFGLQDLEKLLKAHRKDAHPEKILTIQLALRWTMQPWSIQADDRKTVAKLIETRKSVDFIQVLKDKMKPAPMTASLDNRISPSASTRQSTGGHGGKPIDKNTTNLKKELELNSIRSQAHANQGFLRSPATQTS